MNAVFLVSARKLVATFVFVAGALGLSACAQRSAADNPIYLTPKTPLLDKGSAFLLPGGDYRLATVRPVKEASVLCSEPSPDWATAVGAAQAFSLSGGAASGPSGSLAGSAATTELITAMLGRTAGVVALRDGLYSACQAYANGIIGKDAYSLVLSQYGNLLVALGSSSGGGASASSGTPSTPAGVAVAVSSGGTTSSGAPANGQGGGGSSAASVQTAAMQQQAVQALLVACINEQDPTVVRERPNPILSDDICRNVISSVVAAMPDLLKPLSPANTQTRVAPKRANHAKIGRNAPA